MADTDHDTPASKVSDDPALRNLTREQLYEQVWTTPMRHLARSYGLSDVGLAKLCKRHAIPTPPVGYWTKVAHGKAVERPVLPAAENAADAKIVIDPSMGASHRLPVPTFEVTVSETLMAPHPLVKATAAALRRAKPDEQGLLRPDDTSGLPIAVSRGSRDRALRLLNALVKALEARSHQVSRQDDPRSQSAMSINIGGEAVAITLEEIVRREERPLTAHQEREKLEYPWMYRRPPYRCLPTGRLRLEIITYVDLGGRRRWADGGRQQLEQCLASVVVQLELVAAERREARRQRAEEQARYEAWQREREEKLSLIRQEEARVARLYAEVDAWRRSEQIRAYVAAAREHLRIKRGVGLSDPVEHPWLAWATAQADRLDPLTEAPPSILDDKEKCERYAYPE